MAVVRFLGFFLFWGVCLSAGYFHAISPFWWEGEVLQVVLTTPYFCDFSDSFRAFRDTMPRAFDFVLKGALYSQWTWEMFLFPLVYMGRVARFYVALQGFAFFICSVVIMNLGYLPIYELMLWSMLFAPGILSWFRKRSAGSFSLPMLRSGSRFLERFAVASIAITLLFNAVNYAENLGYPWADSPVFNNRIWYGIHRFIGQGTVNVMDKRVFDAANAHMVVVEMADPESGEIARLVPFNDIEGGRLDYLRNDLIYFHYSLGWRKPQPKLVSTQDLKNPDSKARRYVDRIIRFDALLNAPEEEKVYRVYAYLNRLNHGEAFWSWGEAKLAGRIDIRVTPELLRLSEKDLRYTYDLPPGHWRTEAREAKTLEVLREMEPMSRTPPKVDLTIPYENSRWLRRHRRAMLIFGD
jgi:hypothetical protein